MPLTFPICYQSSRSASLIRIPYPGHPRRNCHRHRHTEVGNHFTIISILLFENTCSIYFSHKPPKKSIRKHIFSDLTICLRMLYTFYYPVAVPVFIKPVSKETTQTSTQLLRRLRLSTPSLSSCRVLRAYHREAAQSQEV